MNTVLVSAVVLIQGNQILMQQRPFGKSMAGFWEFPGGKVEEGETFESCAIRELNEELAVQINPSDLNYFATVKHPYDDFKLEMQVYTCNNWMGYLNPQEEQICQWFNQDEIDYDQVVLADVELIKEIWKIVFNTHVIEIKYEE